MLEDANPCIWLDSRTSVADVRACASSSCLVACPTNTSKAFNTVSEMGFGIHNLPDLGLLSLGTLFLGSVAQVLHATA